MALGQQGNRVYEAPINANQVTKLPEPQTDNIHSILDETEMLLAENFARLESLADFVQGSCPKDQCEATKDSNLYVRALRVRSLANRIREQIIRLEQTL